MATTTKSTIQKKTAMKVPTSAQESSTSMVISKITEENNILSFTLSGANVSIANGLRRVVSEISAVIFRTSPYEKNMATFEINTTRMNNELLKQRLSCIPIYADVDFPVKDYMLMVDKQNKSKDKITSMSKSLTINTIYNYYISN